MTDDLLRRFSHLNPVPDPDRFVQHGEPAPPAHPELRAVLEQARAINGSAPRPHPQHQIKETTMSTLSPPRPQQQPSRPRGARVWVLTAGAAAAAVAVGVIIGVSVPGSEEGPTVAAQDEDSAGTSVDDPPAPPPVDADTAIAQAYIEARNAYDVDQARALVAEDFRTNEIPDDYRNLASMEPAFAYAEAYGFEYTDGQCEDPVTRPERVVYVHCDYLWTTELGQITGYPPVPVEFGFRILDGRITHVTYLWNRDDFATNVWEPWADFLDEEHPEYAKLIDDGRPDVETEALQQLPEYFELYEQWLRAQAD